eukprot:1744022-Amphidinium_carterae.1
MAIDGILYVALLHIIHIATCVQWLLLFGFGLAFLSQAPGRYFLSNVPIGIKSGIWKKSSPPASAA